LGLEAPLPLIHFAWGLEAPLPACPARAGTAKEDPPPLPRAAASVPSPLAQPRERSAQSTAPTAHTMRQEKARAKHAVSRNEQDDLSEVPRLPAGATVEQYLQAVGIAVGSWVTGSDSPFAVPGHLEDRTGWTPLHHIIEDVRRSKAPASMLSLLAADSRMPPEVLDTKTSEGQRPPGLTPLQFLVRTGGQCETEKEEALHVLIARRADVNAVDPSGATPLHMVAGWGRGGRWKHC
jgi:hypothetical protein